MSVYLEKFRSVLNTVQARQITNLLVKKQQTGEIQNLEEFRAQLTDLTDKLLSEVISPTLKLFLADFNSIIGSESYNFMLERIRDDLETVYAEVDNIDQIVQSHYNLINNIVLQGIRMGLAELESKISAYEFLAGNRSGFDKAQFNTFRTTQKFRTSRTESDVGIFFKDPRTGLTIDSDVTVDTVGERILLGSNNFQYVPIKFVQQVFDNEATQSEEIVSLQTNPISNIIDGSRGTYWLYSVLQNKLRPQGIVSKIEFQFAHVSNFNFIEIEPASIHPMKLLRIDYIDNNGDSKTIPGIEQMLNGVTRVSFNTIFASRMHLVVSQANAVEVQYENKTNNITFINAVNGQTMDIDLNNVINNLRDSITSSKILEQALMTSQTITPGEMVRYFDYVVGFDNIRAGYSEYASSSIFVSASTIIDELSQIAVKALDTRPIELAGSIRMLPSSEQPTGNEHYHGAIEYWAVLKNFDINDQLIDINIVPLAPIGVSRIEQEALVFSNSENSTLPNVSILRFYSKHFTDTEKNSFHVFRNGTLLTRGLHWDFSDFPFTNDFVPPTSVPNRVAIRIFAVNETDFYTVSYNPTYSTVRINPITVQSSLDFNTSNLNVVDLTGDLSATMNIDNIIQVNKQKGGGRIISYREINLLVILRRTSVNTNLTPAVDEYTLLTTSALPEKLQNV